MPPLEVIAVDTGTGRERFEVMGRTPELPRWIEEDLLPWAGTGKDAGAAAGTHAAGDGDPSSRRTPWPPSRTIVCGQSLGGLAAVSIAAGERRITDMALAQSGSFWFPAWGGEDGGELAAELRQPQVAERLRRRRVRAHLSVGLGERDMVPHSEAIAGALRAAGWGTWAKDAVALAVCGATPQQAAATTFRGSTASARAPAPAARRQ